jgi:hypothetical protein
MPDSVIECRQDFRIISADQPTGWEAILAMSPSTGRTLNRELLISVFCMQRLPAIYTDITCIDRVDSRMGIE